ncbi:MAG: DNA-processing protein DprA [Bacteroidales bacterium]|nr:DNA-processing protein DprA [Bacteroidales bacterium]MCF8403292.1 DNA-processing protein DprA [Bacteroidales bacterium]
MLLYQIAITLIPGIGDINAKKLISYCGSARSVFEEKKQNLMKIPGMGLSTVNSILNQQVLKRAEEELLFIDRNNVKTFYFLDSDYPVRLKNCIDSPVMLYFKGNINLNSSRVMSIVGTRRATEYGQDMCNSFVRDLAEDGLLITSGLAYGIDTLAHKASLKYGLPTVGILAHGLDRIYPYANRTLAESMLDNGGLLTDFISNTNPDRENFPKRNRIIAGLADALLVVESASRGGALITANIANSYNRDVFAIPGKIGDTYSAGCNYLIRTNKAALVQSAEDIKYLMGWEQNKVKSPRQVKLFRELSDEERLVMDILKENETSSIDFVVLKSKLSNSKIAAILLALEFDGLIKNLPGKLFKVL